MTALIFLAAVVFLGWGFYRSRALGKLGILAWLQSVVLMAPWLGLFGLIGVGIVPNLASILLILVLSIAVYIFLGRQLRALAAQDSAGQGIASVPRAATEEINSPKVESDAEPAVTGTPPPIPDAELKTIQGLLGIDTFFPTEVIPYQDGVIFKGNLRGEAATVHAHLSKKLAAALGDAYRLFLVNNLEGKPVVIVLPKRNDPQPATLTQKLFSLILAVATLATCLETGGLMLEFDLLQAPNRYLESLPLGLGIFGILIFHEVGHQVLARRHGVKFSLPFLIPALQIGSFGALNRFESLVPNRKVLFDVALAGPAVGGIVSLVLLVFGLLLSTSESLFQVPTLFFQSSILVGTLSRVVLGGALQEELVAVHPLVVVGWLGLVITAINLMPAGQLDGGRIVQAIYGRKVAGRTTIFTLIFLAIAALVNPLSLYWAILILFLQRDLERPSLEEITEPDDARAALGLLALFLMVAVLMPLTPSLAGRLGIG
ncbi:site-2 protease family protein [Synechococcales cyanobacterium C]|uniref:Site-2 protease family protein n=1 Tax=Petrachloros mirabilis ULC683 TaxID=2781853 RepID=A0A8K2A7F8_9CYAN|nr:site-2 protease family protein [Petrachloros mirabilis]NCJ06159.1 site-2 protease family protein [Petrachloros mirabilis ULC683]